MYHDLLNKAIAFQKQAGLLQVPQNTLKEIEDFAVGTYCFFMAEKYKTILQNYKNLNKKQRQKVSQDQLDDIKICYGYCKRLSANISAEDKSRKSIRIKGSDIPYAPKAAANSVFKIILIFANDDKSSEMFFAENVNSRGLWQPRLQNHINDKNEILIGRIVIKEDVDKSLKYVRTLETLQYKIEDVKSLARHELQHFMQSFIKYMINQMGGLPSKKIRDTKYDEDLSSTVGISNKEHVLADEEFYTNLTDSVHQFNQYKTLVPTSFHRDYMLAWIRHIPVQRFFDLMEQKLIPIFKHNIKTKSLKTKEQREVEWDNITNSFGSASEMLNHSNMFNILKQFNPNKYRKAVAEFSKAVGL